MRCQIMGYPSAGWARGCAVYSRSLYLPDALPAVRIRSHFYVVKESGRVPFTLRTLGCGPSE